MNIFQNKPSENKSLLPTKLDLLDVLTQRSLYNDPNNISELKRLRTGQEGEKVIVDYLQKFGEAHWTLIQNLWLDYFGTLECDGVLFTNGNFFVIEIKNYSGTFEYENGISKLNNREISVNAIYQTRKATMKVRELVNRRFPHVKVHGVLVFVGIDSQIKITSDVEDIHIIQRHELRAFIEKIASEEKSQQHQSPDIEKVIEYLEKFTTENPYPVKPLSPDVLSRIQKGILCDNCASSHVQITKKFVKCSCGMIELREPATVRTICEYGVLNFTEPLTVKSIMDFFDGKASELYVRKILTTHFEVISHGRNTKFRNYAQLYSEISSSFEFKN